MHCRLQLTVQGTLKQKGRKGKRNNREIQCVYRRLTESLLVDEFWL